MASMKKNRQNLDMETIVNEAIANYLEDRKLTGAIPYEKMPPEELARLRTVFLPVIWSAIPTILAQLNSKTVRADQTPEEILSEFHVPDTLEGLIL